jgi:hypothetical protein
VRDWYLESFRDMRAFPEIKDSGDEKDFTQMISQSSSSLFLDVHQSSSHFFRPVDDNNGGERRRRATLGFLIISLS